MNSIIWQDKKTSDTVFTANIDGIIIRRIGNWSEKIEVPCPTAVIYFTKCMSGVDVSNQHRAYYDVGQSSKNSEHF